MEFYSNTNVKYEYKEKLKDIGCLIKRLRESAGLSQNELAMECDMQQCQVCRIENGSASSVWTIYKISRFFDLDVSDLVKGVNYTVR